MKVLAIDLGGTKLATAVVDDAGEMTGFRHVAVERSSPQATAEQIAGEARIALRGADLAVAGLVLPGTFDPADGTAWAPNLWGDRVVPLRRYLEELLPSPVHIDSDRAGYVLGERWLGAARGLNDVVFVAIGTGIGAGILIDGKVVRGACGAAGAVGWMALGPACRWETEGAGPAVARKGGRSSAEEVIDAARKGDPTARATVDQVCDLTSMGVANLISTLDPQMVVLGGGLMQAADLFLEPIRRRVQCWAQPRAAARTRIEVTQLGDRAGLYGAAWLGMNR